MSDLWGCVTHESNTPGCLSCLSWSVSLRPLPGFITKDSGVRAEYDSGMVRDTEEGKARFGLLFPKGVPYANQMLTRFAELMARGAKKYTDRNWELAEGEEELERYQSSALRHLIQWMCGEADEDHAAAVMFNLLAGETVKFKMGNTPPVDCCQPDDGFQCSGVACKPGCRCLA